MFTCLNAHDRHRHRQVLDEDHRVHISRSLNFQLKMVSAFELGLVIVTKLSWRPVFVNSTLECIDTRCIDHIRWQWVPFTNNSNSETMSSQFQVWNCEDIIIITQQHELGKLLYVKKYCVVRQKNCVVGRSHNTIYFTYNNFPSSCCWTCLIQK